MNPAINYRYSNARIFVARLNKYDEIVDFVDATFDHRRNTVMERVLHKGNYLILA